MLQAHEQRARGPQLDAREEQPISTLGSYRWDWNSLRRGSDNLFRIGIAAGILFVVEWSGFWMCPICIDGVRAQFRRERVSGK